MTTNLELSSAKVIKPTFYTFKLEDGTHVRFGRTMKLEVWIFDENMKGRKGKVAEWIKKIKGMDLSKIEVHNDGKILNDIAERMKAINTIETWWNMKIMAPRNYYIDIVCKDKKSGELVCVRLKRIDRVNVDRLSRLGKLDTGKSAGMVETEIETEPKRENTDSTLLPEVVQEVLKQQGSNKSGIETMRENAILKDIIDGEKK